MPMKSLRSLRSSLRSLRSSLRSLRSPLLFVEVMGVVEVMEVTLLFVEVTSFQKSKSLRVVPHSFFQPFIPKINNSCTDGETLRPVELTGDS